MASSRENVLLAMSGGVDSSVAASLLLEAGYGVTGVFLCLGHAGAADSDSRGCCSPQDAADARRVAQTLGIELFVLNMADEFAPVIDNFLAEYRAGRTPNPCVHCNARIKFGRLLRHADALGVRYVATGHHARMAPCDGRPAIFRAKARAKDQSYALFAVAPENLPRMLLPIGELEDKALVRQIARDLDLNVHDKPDSQEICFVEDDDYTRLLAARAPQALTPGDIVDTAGHVLGRHEGYARFTIGQRKGLRVAAGVPMYVTRIDPATATVTLGTREELLRRTLTARGATWHADVRALADEGGAFEAIVQIRYNHDGAPARVRLTGPTTFAADFHEPLAAVTPGQAAVVYRGEHLLGGGWID